MKYVKFIGGTLLLVCLGATEATSAQKGGATLSTCIDIAIRNNIDYQSKQLQQDRVRLRVKSSKNAFLPTLQGGLNHTWDFGRSPDKTGMMNDRSSSSASASINGSLTLFSGFSRLHDLKSAKLSLEATTYGLEQARQNLSIQITQLYFAYLHTQRVRQVTEKQLSRSQELTKIAQEMYAGGKWGREKLADAEATEAQNALNLIQAENNCETALLDLKHAMHVSELELAAFDLNAELLKANAYQAQGQDYLSLAVANHSGLRANLLEQKALQETLKSHRSGYMPTLNLSFGYSNSYYKVLGNVGVGLNSSIVEQLQRNGRSFIGLGLNIPIFDAFRTRNQIRSAKFNLIELEINRLGMEAQLRKEVETAVWAIKLADRKIKATATSYSASLTSRELAEAAWLSGRATSSQLSEAMTRSFVSEVEHINAQFEYVLRSHILRFYLEKK